MGTSSDHPGGVGGAWTPYKVAVSNFVKRGGRPRFDKVLSRYVGAMGGAASAAAAASSAGLGTAGALGDFSAGFATEGLTETLKRLDLGNLVGQGRWEVLDGLSEALLDDSSTDRDVAHFALEKAFSELFPEDAQTYEELEAVELNGDDVIALIQSFVMWMAYRGVEQMLDQKYADIQDPTELAQRDAEAKARLKSLVRLELVGTDPLKVDWKGPEGQGIIGRVIEAFYQVMEELE